jgi:protein ImuB
MPMWWAALLPPWPLPPEPPPAAEVVSGSRVTGADALAGLATWALQFTPRVAVLEGAAVLMELDASRRLFGGTAALRARIQDEAAQLGVAALGWAPTGLAALTLARGAVRGAAAPAHANVNADADADADADAVAMAVADAGQAPGWSQALERQPLAALSAAAAHAPTLARLGCRTLADVRALPRGGVSRRFGAGLLAALDQAYGLQPEAHAWVQLPETFSVRLELPSRVEHAPALLWGARRLLLQLCGWLSARHAGVTALTLHWQHDSLRARDVGEGGALAVRTADATRDIEHLGRLLAEHLAHVTLAAPVGELRLDADLVQPLAQASASLLPESVRVGESLQAVVERVAARLGPQRVLQPVQRDDHRPEWMTHWQPVQRALAGPRSASPAPADPLPQPTFLLDAPLRLAVRDHRPLYQGPLELLLGPHRVEGGWWDRIAPTAAQAAPTVPAVADPGPEHRNTRQVARDYWVAVSVHAGVLWVFQQRLGEEDAGWFLHGLYA